MAGAVEVFNTASWGRLFIAPVGTDAQFLPFGTSPFEYSRFFVMAGEDNTEVFKNGVPVSGTFNKGNSIDFMVQEGDVITSDRPGSKSTFLGLTLTTTTKTSLVCPGRCQRMDR
jgi:hypothetical protein